MFNRHDILEIRSKIKINTFLPKAIGEHLSVEYKINYKFNRSNTRFFLSSFNQEFTKQMLGMYTV